MAIDAKIASGPQPECAKRSEIRNPIPILNGGSSAQQFGKSGPIARPVVCQVMHQVCASLWITSCR
jgi:hypothetical protein